MKICIKYFFIQEERSKYLLTKLDLVKHIERLEKDKEKEETEKEALGPAKYNDGKRKAHDMAIAGIEKRIKQAEDIRAKDGDVINLSASMFMYKSRSNIFI